MELDPQDKGWQSTRILVTALGVLLFAIAGSILIAVADDQYTDAQPTYYVLALAMFGMACLCFLVGAPSRLLRPSPAPRSDAGCPDCDRVLPRSMLAGHLVSAHRYTDEDARTIVAHAKP